jgi:glutathione synthase/RimK-type ligase-like ATP-grasp enzyme
MVDYRYYEADVAYSRANLPQEIVQRCSNFVASYGLAFGAIDLIAAADGRFVFLENNPVGQFIFVEELVPELEISAAVADALIRGSAQ